VRFGAIEAMTGVTASASAALASSSSKPSSGAAAAREDVVQRQRRGRAWRLLVAQAGMQVGAGAGALLGSAWVHGWRCD